MTGVILQPGYLPWLGFFDQMSKADMFVIFDDVQYTKRDWRTRNRIKVDDKIRIITVPVKTAGFDRKELKINQVLIDNSRDWQKDHLGTIQYGYRKADYFSDYFSDLTEILSKNHLRLIDLLMPIIEWVNEILDIKTKIVFSSELKIDESLKKSEKLIAICQELDIDNYLSGNAAENYISPEQFQARGINVRFQNYHHPKYKQVGDNFISHLSIIDLILNCGPKSKEYFKPQTI